MISDAIIEEIKYRNDIEDVISGYVSLKKAGSNLNGLCPFHSEKTPSFTVFPATKTFYCFGCGAGGDVVTFIMRSENLDYPSALEFLAKRAGITIPESGDRNDGIKRSRILDMNRAAAKYFFESLSKSSAAMSYLKSRGLTEPLIRHFGIGFAPDSFGALTGHLSNLGFSAEEMKTGFLCGISSKTKRPYDYFRNRIIFPIIDVSGDVVAFGGRVMDDSMPKYLNTSDTPAFKKSRNLFALNFAKNHCSEQMILCEGYMDVIALHGAGFPNAVATLGTALTPEQARIMKRYTKKVIISYDSDKAGQNAAARAFGILAEAGIEAKILKVTGAKDPDEFIKKFGPERFKLLLSESRSRFDFVLDNTLSKYDISSLDGKVKAAAELCDFISGIPSRVEQDVYISRVAEKLEIPADSLKSDVKRQKSKKLKQSQNEFNKKIISKTEGFGDKVNPDFVKNIRAANAEETIIGILLCYPENIPILLNSDFSISDDCFFTEFNKKVYKKIISVYSEKKQFDIGMLGADFSVDEMGRITKIAVQRQNLSANNIAVLKDCAAILEKERQKSSQSAEDFINNLRKS